MRDTSLEVREKSKRYKSNRCFEITTLHYSVKHLHVYAHHGPCSKRFTSGRLPDRIHIRFRGNT